MSEGKPFVNSGRLFEIEKVFDNSEENRSLFLHSLDETLQWHCKKNNLYKQYLELNGCEVVGTPLTLESISPLYSGLQNIHLFCGEHEKNIKHSLLPKTAVATPVLLDYRSIRRLKHSFKAVFQSLGLFFPRIRHNYLCLTADFKAASNSVYAFYASLVADMTLKRSVYYAVKKSSADSFGYLDLEEALIRLLEFSERSEPLRIIASSNDLMILLDEMKRGSILLELPPNSYVFVLETFRESKYNFFSEKIKEKIAKQFDIEKSNIRRIFVAADQGIPYVECSSGNFHLPVFSEARIVEPESLVELPDGEIGMLNLLSPAITSSLAVSLLFPLKASIVTDCSCGLQKKAFKFHSESKLKAMPAIQPDNLRLELSEKLCFNPLPVIKGFKSFSESFQKSFKEKGGGDEILRPISALKPLEVLLNKLYEAASIKNIQKIFQKEFSAISLEKIRLRPAELLIHIFENPSFSDIAVSLVDSLLSGSKTIFLLPNNYLKLTIQTLDELKVYLPEFPAKLSLYPLPENYNIFLTLPEDKYNVKCFFKGSSNGLSALREAIASKATIKADLSQHSFALIEGNYLKQKSPAYLADLLLAKVFAKNLDSKFPISNIYVLDKDFKQVHSLAEALFDLFFESVKDENEENLSLEEKMSFRIFRDREKIRESLGGSRLVAPASFSFNLVVDYDRKFMIPDCPKTLYIKRISEVQEIADYTKEYKQCLKTAYLLGTSGFSEKISDFLYNCGVRKISDLSGIDSDFDADAEINCFSLRDYAELLA